MMEPTEKNFFQQLSLFTSTGSTASYHLLSPEITNTFPSLADVQSLAHDENIFRAASLLPGPSFRNSALHSAAFSEERVLHRSMQWLSLLHAYDLVANYTAVSIRSLLKIQEPEAWNFSSAGMLARQKPRLRQTMRSLTFRVHGVGVFHLRDALWRNLVLQNTLKVVAQTSVFLVLFNYGLDFASITVFQLCCVYTMEMVEIGVGRFSGNPLYDTLYTQQQQLSKIA